MEISNYYGNSKDTLKITHENIEIFYSYENIIAIKIDDKLFIAKNKWSAITGRHLNIINRDKSIRIDYNTLLEIADTLKITIG